MKNKLTSLLIIAASCAAGAAWAIGPPSGGDQPDPQVLLERFDMNQDRFITREEAVNVPELSAQWESLDSNRDGRLDAQEFGRFQPQGAAR